MEGAGVGRAGAERAGVGRAGVGRAGAEREAGSWWGYEDDGLALCGDRGASGGKVCGQPRFGCAHLWTAWVKPVTRLVAMSITQTLVVVDCGKSHASTLSKGSDKTAELSSPLSSPRSQVRAVSSPGT